MSTYCTISGQVVYDTQEDFDAAVAILKIGHWMDDEGFFIDEIEERITENPNIDQEARFIEIPLFHYRNLGWTLDEKKLLRNANADVIWTCTDGDFQGGVISQGKETLYDLMKWAKENMDQDPPDIETDPDAYCEWQHEVEMAFFEDFS